MNYKKILFPINKKKKCDINLKVIEKNINEIKEKLNFQLPEEYINMLKACDGGKFDNVYVPCRRENGEIYYNYIDIIYGVSEGYWTIQSIYEHNLDEVVREDFGILVYEFFNFVDSLGKVDEFKKNGVLPSYINRDSGYEELMRFYKELTLYKDKLDDVIDKLEFSNNRKTKEQIIFLYNVIKFHRFSLEFASMDGCHNFRFFYEDKYQKEPSVWFVKDYDKIYRLANNFKEFMEMLLVKRDSIYFGMSEINAEVHLFINKLLFFVFNKEVFVSINDILNEVINNNREYNIKFDKEFSIRLTTNAFHDGRGFNEPYRREFKFILEIGSGSDLEEDIILFKRKYERRIIDILKESNFSTLKLLYNIGYHNLDDVIETDGYF